LKAKLKKCGLATTGRSTKNRAMAFLRKHIEAEANFVCFILVFEEDRSVFHV